MKVMLLISIILLSSFHMKAQTFNEWFRQKKTQREYLIKQIALLQQYIGYAKKGYDIAQKGLGTISQIKNGDLNIHRVFLNALKEVNPSLARYPKAVDVISSIVSMNAVSSKTIREVNSNNFMDAGNRDYTRQVLNNIRMENEKAADDLLQMFSNGILQLSDDQRLSRIDQLYAAVKDREAFLSAFISQLSMLIKQRHTEMADVEMSRIMYGLK
ncbi:hypothetical protein CLV59_105225 [Chitinophaga dinghuensis]|uniref:TerB family tellurite resistance protein n=1 Tax=Chitinophaga dinghuensis TaxID=1539050 RepID=A0A327W563_9BACT|nr:hypothetical protein [Chitinophaga dinghuensis]RAJ80118.1 hypothetical protein CLV59_105225 [Chitinophaga dinghuensis]